MNKIILKMLNNDISATLESYPNLRLISHAEDKLLQGDYIIKDYQGNLQGKYKIKIIIPKKYPFEFPELYEIGNNIIPRCDDRHIDNRGLACVEIEQNIILKSKKGITIKEFIDKYVHRYLCWQLRYDCGDIEGLEEWAHGNKGTLQFYEVAFNTVEKSIILKILNALIENNLPSRNEQCICNSKIKFKQCHLELIQRVSNLGKRQFQKDCQILSLMI